MGRGDSETASLMVGRNSRRSQDSQEAASEKENRTKSEVARKYGEKDGEVGVIFSTGTSKDELIAAGLRLSGNSLQLTRAFGVGKEGEVTNGRLVIDADKPITLELEDEGCPNGLKELVVAGDSDVSVEVRAPRIVVSGDAIVRANKGFQESDVQGESVFHTGKAKSGVVRATDKATVYADGRTQIEAASESVIRAAGDAHVTLKESSAAYLEGRVTCVALDKSRVWQAKGKVTIRQEGSRVIQNGKGTSVTVKEIKKS